MGGADAASGVGLVSLVVDTSSGVLWSPSPSASPSVLSVMVVSLADADDPVNSLASSPIK